MSKKKNAAKEATKATALPQQSAIQPVNQVDPPEVQEFNTLQEQARKATRLTGLVSDLETQLGESRKEIESLQKQLEEKDVYWGQQWQVLATHHQQLKKTYEALKDEQQATEGQASTLPQPPIAEEFTDLGEANKEVKRLIEAIGLLNDKLRYAKEDIDFLKKDAFYESKSAKFNREQHDRILETLKEQAGKHSKIVEGFKLLIAARDEEIAELQNSEANQAKRELELAWKTMERELQSTIGNTPIGVMKVLNTLNNWYDDHLRAVYLIDKDEYGEEGWNYQSGTRYLLNQLFLSWAKYLTQTQKTADQK